MSSELHWTDGRCIYCGEATLYDHYDIWCSSCGKEQDHPHLVDGCKCGKCDGHGEEMNE